MKLSRYMTDYLVCVLWSSTDDDGNPLDDNYGVEDINTSDVMQHEKQLEDFIEANWDDISEADLDLEQVAHDFWLTRNGHGTGFWDRGLGEVGERLSAAAKVYGSSDAYVGDDGKVYLT